MGWSTPATWVAGTVVTASDMNTYIRDNQRYLKGIGQVPTIESGLTIDNTDGDERLLLPLLSTAEIGTVLNVEGEVAFDEQTHQMKEYDGTAVRALISEADVDDTPVNGVTTFPISSNWAYDFINTLTTQADLPYATAAGTWARLAKGTGTQYLRMNSGATAPEWTSVTLATKITKTSNETVNNSNTVQNDDELTFAVGANSIWSIKFVLKVTSSAVADFRMKFTIPVAATCSMWFEPSGIVSDYDATTEYSPGTDGTTQFMHGYLFYEGGANAGNIQLQWAQGTAEVSDTTVYIGSFMIGDQIA